METHEATLGSAARHGYRIFDALIPAAALVAGSNILSSEDKHDGRQIEEMTIQSHLLPRGEISNPGVLRLRSP
jgi:predicted nucleic acid-binding protein